MTAGVGRRIDTGRGRRTNPRPGAGEQVLVFERVSKGANSAHLSALGRLAARR